MNNIKLNNGELPGILMLSSYPPRECGIATYTQDLVRSLKNKFGSSFLMKICALESEHQKYNYEDDVHYTVDVSQINAFISLAKKVNADADLSIVMIQHEFGLFIQAGEKFIEFLKILQKPIVVAFHTVLPHPDSKHMKEVQEIASAAASVIVMTQYAAGLLENDYSIPADKIEIIPHGTHLVPHVNKSFLKKKYRLDGRQILSTFGLLGSGKSIETTLQALPEVVKVNPDVLFLIIGKTHPSILKKDGEQYREFLQNKVNELNLHGHVRFINQFLPLEILLEYLQLTDIYLFTSSDPNQTVSGTFSYALSSGCPIISTPIPHAKEVLKTDGGVVFDFGNSRQLSVAINDLLADEELRANIGSNGLHRMASTAWENAAIAHALLFENLWSNPQPLQYDLPPYNLDHIHKMTTDFGMIQFARLNQPDIESGYTLDDNARALIAVCSYYELTGDETAMPLIVIYFNFIKHCRLHDGSFSNYVNQEHAFTTQNMITNLEDSNGRAIWALGYMINMRELLPYAMMKEAKALMTAALYGINKIHSTRAMAFIIKGLYYHHQATQSPGDIGLIREFADRLVQMYKHESSKEWLWFESYLTYANSILPEALLCAALVTGESKYKEVAKISFDFLLSNIFVKGRIKVVSNRNWLQRGDKVDSIANGGEQPIDVAYTILALEKFYASFHELGYLKKIETAFNWFLGNNHLGQIIYNPRTGGCYDGLEENYVNLNQGAESTVSYLMARSIAGSHKEIYTSTADERLTADRQKAV